VARTMPAVPAIVATFGRVHVRPERVATGSRLFTGRGDALP
jgi:hypothetical protein